MSRVPWTSTSAVCGRKPVLVTWTVYLPGLRSEAENFPDASVVNMMGCARFSPVISTLASATGRPEGSFTVPLRVSARRFVHQPRLSARISSAKSICENRSPWVLWERAADRREKERIDRAGNIILRRDVPCALKPLSALRQENSEWNETGNATYVDDNSIYLTYRFLHYEFLKNNSVDTPDCF